MGAGDAARAVAWSAALTLVARHTAGAWQLARTLAWLRAPADHGRQGERSLPGAGPDVHVVVPVLREQQHVAAAFAWWKAILTCCPGMSLTIVSTAREEHERGLLAVAVCSRDRLSATEFPQLSARELADLGQARAAADGRVAAEVAAEILARTPLTRQVVDELLAGQDHPRIRHVTYPGAGRKAAQINYAARSLPTGGYLAVYDVDSRPGAETLTAVCTVLTAGQPPVVQQHALHAVPRNRRQPTREMFVTGTATLQTVWTLRREIPYARRYQRSSGRSGGLAWVRAGLSQPVGHGLFLRNDVLHDLGGLPEQTVLDDVPAGVTLTMRGIPTMSVPRLAVVPAPHTVTEVVAQGRRWFCSYLDYPALLRSAARDGEGTPLRRRLAAGVALYRGIAWLAASPVTAVTVMAAVAPRSGRRLRTTAITGVLLAAVVPVVMTAAVRRERLTAWVTGRDSVELLAAYLLRSVGPWLAVADAARGRHPVTAGRPSPKAHRREGAAS